MEPQSIDKGLVRQLVEGRIDDGDAVRLMRMARKDPGRFFTYLEVLQERVPWNHPILLRISDHLYIVRNERGERVVMCECGHDFGDYRRNWKLGCRIRVRRTLEEFKQVYDPEPACPEPGWQEIREFFCPGEHAAQLAVEIVPPGYPLVFEMLPDLDLFYREYLGRPLPDESPDWYCDRTHERTRAWAEALGAEARPGEAPAR